MTTTVNVTAKWELVLPKKICQRKKIKPGTAVRVTEVGDGLYVSPVPEPTEQELSQVMASAGSLIGTQTAEDEDMLQQIIGEYRAEKRRKRG